MKIFLQAALFGAVLATAVFFLHFMIPVLLLLLVFVVFRRALFGPRWRHAAYAGYGPHGYRAQRTPTVDGRDWQRPVSVNAEVRDVQVN